MEAIEIAMVLLIAVALVYVLYRRSAGWRTLQTAEGTQTSQLEAQYQHLRSQRIKCRLQPDTHVGALAVHTAAAAVDLTHEQPMKLEVHERDHARAERLLLQYGQAVPGTKVAFQESRA